MHLHKSGLIHALVAGMYCPGDKVVVISMGSTDSHISGEEQAEKIVSLMREQGWKVIRNDEGDPFITGQVGMQEMAEKLKIAVNWRESAPDVIVRKRQPFVRPPFVPKIGKTGKRPAARWGSRPREQRTRV